ncbi:MAG: exosome complex RNA-binding protein Csl4 [Nitrososphaeraceae archaeon]|jgi:exosome complex component CSL4
MKKKTSGMVFPGEYIAEIEEFEAGRNTFILDGTIRSSVLGKKEYDFKRRTIKIDQINSQELPKIGDVVMGFVEMLFGSMISVKLFYVNNRLYTSGLSAIASARMGNNKGWNRDRYNKKAKSIYRIGDIIRGQITSLLNSSIHLAVDGTDFGLLYSLCLNCGGDTVKINNGIKCIECSTYEEKRVANNYGTSLLKSLYQS